MRQSRTSVEERSSRESATIVATVSTPTSKIPACLLSLYLILESGECFEVLVKEYFFPSSL